ncbi:MAG: endonuclease/exonuclease/phosphatase family protein [Aromatoleum sp.]|jgi:endonuclease/exonuclease/phosphatase family metal-dependent hydrolase|uniref:endonuclease/exonuclease/phosphatase family protein n=1 Tax=Aromatoleum sp. TaxID=2307007 RepID=UPI0028952E0E|nr:endonuclease/exonuclease/phosphatase family protein [Aromatoleum sp.]MDT3670904.1 endonuclease/exonuclease/phosphatase family protein [Aromatoleum sp.]
MGAARGAGRGLRVCTYNIHKGFSQFNRRMVVHELRERLRSLDVDLVFLQEVQGLHLGHATRHADWPGAPQHEFLAEDVWQQTAYGGNAIYDHGHHGNAILSRFPITYSTNTDVSDHRFERRGLLHCEVQVPDLPTPIHCVCAHLGLTSGSRRRQMEVIADRMEQLAPAGAPLIICGDFNDWRNRADNLLARRLGMREAFDKGRGRPARTFPSTVPVLRLDRIYVRGFGVRHAQVHCGLPWSQISDHSALTAELEPRV